MRSPSVRGPTAGVTSPAPWLRQRSWCSPSTRRNQPHSNRSLNRTSAEPGRRFQYQLPAPDAISDSETVTHAHNQGDEITRPARALHTAAIGSNATTIVASTACGRYRVARGLISSLTPRTRTDLWGGRQTLSYLTRPPVAWGDSRRPKEKREWSRTAVGSDFLPKPTQTSSYICPRTQSRLQSTRPVRSAETRPCR